jgi:hypothetical protein
MNDYAFNVRLNQAMKADQIYRVYPDRELIYFIRISGQPMAAGVAAGLQAQLGGLGRSMGAGLVKRSKRKIQEAAKLADMKDFRTQVHSHKNSFALPIMKIISATIDPPKLVSGHGPHEGIWMLETSGGKTLKFQFEEVEDLRRAAECLPPVLGVKLVVNIAWR